jgi:hypothetical protein
MELSILIPLMRGIDVAYETVTCTKQVDSKVEALTQNSVCREISLVFWQGRILLLNHWPSRSGGEKNQVLREAAEL